MDKGFFLVSGATVLTKRLTFYDIEMEDQIEMVRGMGFTHVSRDIIVKVQLICDQSSLSVCSMWQEHMY